MANELKSLSDIFQNKLFRIPDYQRGYAWGKDQLLDFWEDLTNLSEDRYHYTGLLSLKEISKKDTVISENDKWLTDNGYKLFHVVDGQQRLTTFQILLNEIVTFIKELNSNLTNEEEILLGTENLKYINEKYLRRRRPPQNFVTTYLFGYETDNPSYEFLKYKIFNEPNSGTLQETFYTKNLMYAKDFFCDVINKLYNSEGIDGIINIFKKLTLNLMFNLHEIEDDYDVFVAFETMNNRGKRLSNLELLKNRLIYLTTLYDDNNLDELDKKNLRDTINDSWKEIYFQLGRNQRSPLSDDDFLQAHWIMYFKYTRTRGSDYVNFLLNKFSSKNIFSKIITPINSSMEDLQVLQNDLDDDEDDIHEQVPVKWSKLKPLEIRAYVNNLKLMAKYWYYTYFPYDSTINGDIVLDDEEKEWIDRLNRINIAYFRPLLAVILSKINTTTIEERISAYKAIERFIFIEFRMGGVQSTYKSSYYYIKTRELLLNEITISQLTKDLESTTTDDSFNATLYFIAKIKQNFLSKEGYYSWKGLRYFLYEYEYQLSIKKNIYKIEWNMFTKSEKDKITIEHILPQTSNNSYWREKFSEYSSKDLKILTGSIGNLLPLSQSINSSLQNDSFSDKKNPPSTKKRRGYINGSHSEIEISRETDWTSESIYNRGIKLLKFLENRWGIDLTKQQKEQLIFLTKQEGKIIIKG